MKINPRSKSSGQILVIVIIVLVLIGIGFWWLFSNKQQMAKEGNEFGRKVIQELVMQHNVKFFADHLSPAMRLQYPPSAQQDLMTQLDRLGTPLSVPMCRGIFNFSHTFLSQTAISTRTSIIRPGELTSTSPFPIRSVVGKSTRSNSRQRRHDRLRIDKSCGSHRSIRVVSSINASRNRYKFVTRFLAIRGGPSILPLSEI